MSTQPMPPGWYPDQHDPRLVRYWTGSQWTAQTAPSQRPQAAALAHVQSRTMRNRWKSLRLRTKVLAVVLLLAFIGWVTPDATESGTPAAAQSSDRTQRGSGEEDRTPSSDSTEDGTTQVTEEPTEVPTEEPEPVLMPEVSNQDVNAARSELRRSGAVVKVVKRASWKAAGVVLQQKTEPGTVLAPGQVVTLLVAAPMPAVPGVLGRASTAAVSALQNAGFTVRVTEKVVPSGTNGVILSQLPAPTAQAAPGSVVNLVVSNVVAPPPPPPPPPPAASNCTPGYSPCLAPASDYDCAGGSGNGPMYASGPIRVTGSDPYDLDSEGDGIACE